MKQQNLKQLQEHYIIKEKIGQGSYSKVFLCQKKTDKKLVAIKILQVNNLPDYVKQNLLRQIEILNQLKHKNIIKIFDTNFTNNYYYLILQYCKYKDLGSFIKKNKNGGLPQNIIKIIIYQLIEGIFYIHQNAYVHRDLKMPNILISQDFTIKICDFGLAHQFDPLVVVYNQINFDTYCGTLITMAPQIYNKKQYTSVCDIWSLGIILYELIYGQLPFEQNEQQRLMTRKLIKFYNDVKSYVFELPKSKKISKNLQNLLMGMIVYNPTKRLTIYDLKNHSFFKNFKQEKVLQ